MTGKFIVGDSREILRQDRLSSLKGRVRLIYIDPPYNTHTSKTYCDNHSSISWKKDIIGVLEDLKDFLSEKGAIFISIDDNEYANLKLACDEIFGQQNFIGTFITRQAQRSNSKFINITHEYIICFAKQKSCLANFSIRRMDIPEQRQMITDIVERVGKAFAGNAKAAKMELSRLINYYCDKNDISWLRNYKNIDSDGRVYFAADLSVPGQPRPVHIEEINLHLEPLKTRSWISDARFVELHDKGLLVFRKGRPYYKKYLTEARDNAPSVLNFYSRFGTRDMARLGLRDLFDTPKPVELVKFLIRIMGLENGDYVLDCFAGSGATGHAVIEINIEDKKEINFILIQRHEKISGNSKSFFSCEEFGIDPFISEVAKLRLKKVYEKYGIVDGLEIEEYE